MKIEDSQRRERIKGGRESKEEENQRRERIKGER